MVTTYLILAGLWAAYFAVHSLLAMNGIKEWTFKRTGLSSKSYRLSYVIIATLGLIPILLYVAAIDEEYLIERSGLLNFVAWLLMIFGAIIFGAAFKQFNPWEFLGLANENGKNGLRIRGILKYLRHPLYLGTLSMVMGYVLLQPKISSLVTLMSVTLYLIIGANLEERKLIKQYGEEYILYRRRVPGIIPRLRVKGKQA